MQERWNELGDFILRTLHWKLFFAFVSLSSGVISIKQDVSAEARHFWLGILALAAVVLVALLVRDVARWLSGSYHRDDAYQANARLVGVGYEEMKVTGWLRPDGSMQIRRSLRVRAFADRVERLDYYMFAREAPEGKTIEATAFSDSVAPFGTRKQSKVSIEFEYYKRSHDQSVGVVTFTPPLAKGQVTEFDYQDKLIAGSFAITPDKLATGMDREFFAWDITRPTRQLALKVNLDPDTPVTNASYDVWHGVTKMSHQHEYASIAGGWNDRSSAGPLLLSLDVQGPILGLSYVISWRPAGKVEPIPARG